jgi:hypothetical protein
MKYVIFLYFEHLKICSIFIIIIIKKLFIIKVFKNVEKKFYK